MEGEVMTPAQFARKLGVSGNAVYKAIRTGRLVAYDGDGNRVPAGYSGQKWLKPGMAAEDWRHRRQRFKAISWPPGPVRRISSASCWKFGLHG
jgi:hypothetical protein